MRQFSILLVFLVAFGGAAVLYEKESRKVKGVLSQITDLQAKVGDMQAEINRLNGELEAVKLAERRRPNLNAIASRVLKNEPVKSAESSSKATLGKQPANLMTNDVTSTAPAIRGRGESEDEREWSRPTVDAEVYEAHSQNAAGQEAADPYQ
ncbi:hypothetical protein PVT68_03215 [Microbulbifer bruguierae]|uniref:Cell division protein FtsL n=1 Tax=Microbulbifer bruguierae TaxID=3029061 RepID=A0ABY8NIB9_9GAMM|nr:hypothetical protein [Microbulbifer bruguierae]WGL17313.1 hypothetical protein PVT68_03215 [Microbulbifer bruguierae]